jgi:DNA repair protein RadC
MEKLGVASLSDAELIAIMLRTGVQGQSAVELGAMLLDTFSGVRGLVTSPASRLRDIRGLGKVKSGQIAASIELARRMARETMAKQPAFHSSKEVADYLKITLGHYRHEVFYVLWLNNQHHLICDEIISEGTLNEAMVYPREVVKSALKHDAAAAILAHNHPSGADTSPSPADIAITRRLINALGLMDIRVLDHFIVSGNRAVGMADNGFDFTAKRI